MGQGNRLPCAFRSRRKAANACAKFGDGMRKERRKEIVLGDKQSSSLLLERHSLRHSLPVVTGSLSCPPDTAQCSLH